MTALVLDARDVTVRARGAPLVDRLTLAVAAGSIHALVGRNGTGKSTFLRAVLGAVDFTGTIRRAEPLGYVPQRFEPDRAVALTVGELLALTRQRRPAFLGTGPASARVTVALASVDLAGLGGRLVSELSGGELRRVLLANAFEPRPRLLLLDEPTEGLDRAAVARFEAQLRSARADGTGVLLVSHDHALVERLADCVTDLDGTDGVTGDGDRSRAEPIA